MSSRFPGRLPDTLRCTIFSPCAVLGTPVAFETDCLAFQRILVVEPDGRLRARLRRAVAGLAEIDTDAGAPTARDLLLVNPYDWLVTNIRLDAYNGLHLAYLAASAGRHVRTLVYGERSDVSLAREAQHIGAFFEARVCIHHALPRYLTGALPPIDRRDPGHADRRTAFRGGRRSSDIRIVAH